MHLTFNSSCDKSTVFDEVKNYLADLSFQITQYDETRPWGGFYYIHEGQSNLFKEIFFKQHNDKDQAVYNKLSPKILMIAPHKRLSWQYHLRRSEVWTVIGGEVAVIMSDTDQQNEPIKLVTGDFVKLKQGMRHRLIGVDGWGVVAEIWQHTDLNHPSDEMDIIRVEDDFGR